jgi:hypothetical protein
MKDESLTEALRSLPRERAGRGFTDAVLARLPGGPPPRHFGAVRLAVAGALLVLLAALPVALRRPAPAPTPRQARLAELRQERERLALELAEVKRLAEGGLPVVYLGSDDQTDVVLDLERLARRRPGGDVRPAAYDPRAVD